MKNVSTLLLTLVMVFVTTGLFSQQKKESYREKLYPNGIYNPYQVLDTRVDNMGYWRKAAELGLASVAPKVDIPLGTFKGSKIAAKSVWREDSPDVPVTNVNSTQSENSIFVDPTDPDHVLQSNNSTQNPVGSLYGANYFFSYDFGLTWGGTVQGAGGSNSGDPATGINLEGRQYVGFIHSNGGQGIAYSNDGTSWTSVVCGTPPGGWNILDKNHMWVDNSPTSPYEGNVYSAWTGFGNANDSEIEFVRSTNDGLTYSSHMNISSAVNAGSHNQGVNIQTGPNGEVYCTWAIYDSWPSDETAIGFARSLNGGATFETATRIRSNIRGVRTSGVGKNQRVNSFPSSACDISGDGTIYVVWANIGVPGINTGSDTDIYMIKSSNQGTTWSNPIKVNQDASGLGNIHYFPWITCDPETGALSVVFYDDRNTTASKCEVWCANSFDGGETWEDFRVSDVDFTPTPIPGLAGSYMGDYLGISARGGKVYPVWTDTRSGTAMTYTSPYETNSLPRPADLTGSVTFETGQVSLGWSFEPVATFQYFIIYRDGFQVATTTDPFYSETLPTYGIFKYKVTAMHTDGESSGPSLTLQWGDAHVAVEPDEIIEYIDLGSTSTRYVNISNVGQLDLYYEVSSSTEPTRGKDYCDATTSVEDEFIANVECGTINNSSGWQGGVANYTNIYTEINAGESESITVENGNAWASDIVYVWVDWNDDFTFAQNSTEQYQLTNVGGQGQTFTGTITVPMGTVGGEHRMRVRMTYSSAPEPCGSSTYGEIEDYTIKVNSWLFVERVTDTLAPGNTDIIEVNFNSQDLTEGTYFGNVKVESNDPDMPVVDVPITLNVGGSFPLALNVVANPANICIGSGSQLSAMAQGGSGSYTYSWTSDPAGFTSNSPEPYVTPTATTTYICEVNDGETIVTGQASVVVSDIPAQPAAPQGETAYCQGVYQSVYSTNGSAGSNTYAWQLTPANAGTIAGTGLTATVTWNDEFTGTASVMVAGVNICGQSAMSDALEVAIHALPVVELGSDVTICANETMVLDAGNPGAQYLWSTGATTQTIAVDTTGVGIGNIDIWVTVTSPEDCQNTDSINIQFDDCTGISENSGQWSVQVFPNPGSGLFTITLTSFSAEKVDLNIYNALGKEVYTSNQLTIDKNTELNVNLQNQPDGIYFLNLKGHDINLIKKMVIRK